jgi:hypothetical protein
MDRDVPLARQLVGGRFMDWNDQYDRRLAYDGFMDHKHPGTSELVSG